jgi:lauroyl/myristoyl acyltransferase
MWHFRRFGDVVDPDALALRLAYGNLYAALGKTSRRSELRRMALESRRSLRRTQFELQRPTLWAGFAFEGLEHLERVTAAGRGALVVSFHVGPYRFIPLELAHQGHRVELVVDQQGTTRETGILDRLKEALKGVALDRTGRYGYWRADLMERLGVINAEKADCAIRMAHALRAGHLVMVYLDGNAGAGARKPAHLQEATLFGTPILLRAGLGEIAKVTGAPVLPVLSWRRGFRRHFCRFYPPIVPAADEGRARFSRRLTAELVSSLEGRLQAAPGDWEEWHHLHRMQAPQEDEPSGATASPRAEGVAGSRYAVDSYRAFPVSQGSAHYVFEPERRRFVTVPRLDFELLRAMDRPQSEQDILDLLGPAHGREAVRLELSRLRERGWVEARP